MPWKLVRVPHVRGKAVERPELTFAGVADMTDDEPAITINGLALTTGQAMTVRCAIESFAASLVADGLGDDETDKEMCAGYLARIAEIRGMIAVVSAKPGYRPQY
jgi:hypothetical protein